MPRAAGTACPSCARGEKADIAVVLKDASLTTDAFRLEDYDFSKLIDSFSACTPKAEVVSSGSDRSASR